MHKENIVVIAGAGGGREAALVQAYARSPLVKGIIALNFNDLMPLVSQGKLIDNPGFKEIEPTDIPSIIQICQHYNVALLDVPQDNAVAAGVVDAARAENILTVGPTMAAGKIESDKGIARYIGRVAKINQPDYLECDSKEFGIKCIDTWEEKVRWIKAVGLAKGRGAMRAKTREEAYQRIAALDQFGQAGKRFLLEDNLMSDDGTPGQEFSYFVLCNGEEFTYLGSAVDNKPVGNGDTGPNTGGMGGQNSPDFVDLAVREEVEKNMIAPVLGVLNELGHPYTGVLYASCMQIMKKGKPEIYNVEFNARLGDPEAQLILPGIKNDWFEVGMHLAEGGSLKDLKIENDHRRRVVVTMAAKGYPDDYSDANNKRIMGWLDASLSDNVTIYGAGVRKEGRYYLTAGGRVLHVMGDGRNIGQAINRAYGGVHKIRFEGNNQIFRDDIGWQEAERFFRENNSWE